MSKKQKNEEQKMPPGARYISPDVMTRKLNAKLAKGKTKQSDDIFFEDDHVYKNEDTEMNVIPPINDPFKGFTDLSIYDDKQQAFKGAMTLKQQMNDSDGSHNRGNSFQSETNQNSKRMLINQRDFDSISGIELQNKPMSSDETPGGKYPSQMKAQTGQASPPKGVKYTKRKTDVVQPQKQLQKSRFATEFKLRKEPSQKQSNEQNMVLSRTKSGSDFNKSVRFNELQDQNIGFKSDRQNLKAKIVKASVINDNISGEIQFDKEVDFHHQIAFRFEKSWRLRMNKKHESVIKAANQDITSLIENQLWIIDIDPMIVFYCLYFIVYYQNDDILVYIKSIIQRMGFKDQKEGLVLLGQPQRLGMINKMQTHRSGKTSENNNHYAGLDRRQQIAKIVSLLDKMQQHGIKSLDNNKSQVCQEFYHIVFYQAIEDNLRLIYDQIIGKLREIYIRDRDALHFIRQRDFKIIEKTFEKSCKGLFTGLQVQKQFNDQTAKAYRSYNRAFYQEIIIKNDVEARTQFLFKQKFLKTNEDIDSVLEMYCQIDDLEQFSKFNQMIKLSAKRVEVLFLVCLKYDSFLVAFHLNQKFTIKFNQTVINALQNSLKDTQWYIELKLFFIAQSFPYLNVAQIDELLTLFTTVCNEPNPKKHPLVNCYNPVKCSLLMYDICWRVEQKNIYSLQRKCDLLMSYLKKSLNNYLNSQGNISHLYRLMREPILHPKEQQDSMDLILKMGIDDLIQHKVVEEVLNLVYDGKYSIDTSILYLSSVWNTMTTMPTFTPKSVFKRIVNNINTMGAWRLKKQSSVQFHIWKQCIRQRETDEMIFMCMVSFSIVIITCLIDQQLSTQFQHQFDAFGTNIYGSRDVLLKATDSDLKDYCGKDLELSLLIYSNTMIFRNIKIFCAISYLASIKSQILTTIKQINVSLDIFQILFESVMIFSGFYLNSILQIDLDDTLSGICSKHIEIPDEQKLQMDLIYTMQSAPDQIITIQLMMSLIVCLHCVNILSMLRRTDNVGPSIIMMVALRFDLLKFFIAFGLPLVCILMIGVFNSRDFTYDNLDAWGLFIQLFSAFTGEQEFSLFKEYAGQIYLVLFILMYFVMLLNLLIAMFSNTYQIIYDKKESIRLRRILQMKNQLSFDPIVGSVTSTFFPINVVMIPFMIFIVVVKNKKANEMINKLQYTCMIFLQSIAITMFQIILSPIIYAKMILNSFNIMIISKNQKGIERYMEPFLIIMAGPFIIVLTILTDLLSLPGVLLQPEGDFEEKYQRNVDELNEDQLLRVNKVFQMILFQKWLKYQGKYATYLELMSMHRSRFGIMENLNDLLCKGSKDYKESLSTVQDFNSTKIMTRICSVPAKNGDITQNKIYFDMLKIINLDIQIFNHIFDIFNGGKGLHAIYENENNKNKKTPKILEEQLIAEFTKRKAASNMKKGGDGTDSTNVDDENTNITDQFKRDPYDVMSFYQTNMLSEAFTDMDKYAQDEMQVQIEVKVSQLYQDMENLLMKQECETVEKLNGVILNKTTNYRADLYTKDREAVSTKYFLRSFQEFLDDEDEAKNDRKEIRLDYVREEDVVPEQAPQEVPQVQNDPQAAKKGTGELTPTIQIPQRTEQW